MDGPNYQGNSNQQYHSEPNPSQPPSEKRAYEELRSKYQRNLDDFRKRSTSGQRHGRVASDEVAQKSMTDGGSILSGSIVDPDQSSATQHRRKKSVRFQVYDAKNMSALQQMRTTMAEKLETFKERSNTPTGRIQIQHLGTPPSQGSLQGSLSFKPGQLTEAISQNVGSKKTPRPLKLGQPLSDDETEQNNQSMSISQRNSKRQLEEELKAGDKGLDNNSGIYSDRVQSKGDLHEYGTEPIVINREQKLKKQQAVYKLYDALHNHKIVGQSHHIVDIFDALKKRSIKLGELIEKSEKRRATIVSRAVLRALYNYRKSRVNKRNKQAMAETFNIQRLKVNQKLILCRMRQVLKFEAKWIKEVRYQFAYSLREEAFKSMHLNVKYEKTTKLLKMNRYRELLRQMLVLVKASRNRQAEADEYFQIRVKEQVIKRLTEYMVQQKAKKVKIAKAENMRRRQLQGRALAYLAGYYRARKTIRNDKLLWQAHTSKEEFFNVGVLVGSGMQPIKSKQPEMQDSCEGEFHTLENVQVAKQSLIQIKLE